MDLKKNPLCKPTDHDEASKAYLKFQGTRKLDCPAQIQVRGIKTFPEYEVKECNCQTANSLKLAKKKVLDRLKNDMSSAMTINTVMHYHLKVLLSTEHQGELPLASTIVWIVELSTKFTTSLAKV